MLPGLDSPPSQPPAPCPPAPPHLGAPPPDPPWPRWGEDGVPTVSSSYACFGKSSGWGPRVRQLQQSMKRETCGRPAGCRSARPCLATNFGQSCVRPACYVTAVSQRAGMRRTLCSQFCERTNERAETGARRGPDITAQAARPRAPPPSLPTLPRLLDPGLRSCSGDSERPPEAPHLPLPRPQASGALAVNGPGSPRPPPTPPPCGSQGKNSGKGFPGRERQLPWKGQWVVPRGQAVTARP